MIQSIKFEGRNINDVFNLQCVRSVEKLKDGRIMATVQTKREGHRATVFVGDTISYDTEQPEIGVVVRAWKNIYCEL